MPFLSVIVPIYNAQKYLKTCLSSILEQTFRDFELILVNDGSTDQSRAICEECAEKNDNVIVINKKNGGLVSARKAGVQAAQGKYIAYVDADDKIDINMYADMCTEACREDVDIVICDVLQWEETAVLKLNQGLAGGVYKTKKDLEERLYPCMLDNGGFYNFGLLPAMWNKLYKADIIRKNQNLVDNNITIGEDAACSYFCLLDAESVSYLKGRYYYYYRINNNSMCHVWNNSRIYSTMVLLSDLFTRFSSDRYEHMLGQYWYYFCYMCTNLIFEYCESVKRYYAGDKMYHDFSVLTETKEFREFQDKFPMLDLPKERKAAILYLTKKGFVSTIVFRMVIFVKKLYGHLYRLLH